jgi:putative hydrolase of the HAD superfamily
VTIRAVTFDCWGTLINDQNLEKAAAARTQAIIDVAGLSTDEASDLFQRGWREHHNQWVGGVQYGAEGIAAFVCAELGIDDDLVRDRLTEAFEEAGRHGTLEALDGAPHTLRTLRAAGIRTALVCDTGLTPGRVVRDFLSDLDLLDNLEFCAFSNEVGVPKPDARIFHAALEAIDSKPDEAVHVGDLLRTDIHGGRSVGMKTVRITAVNDDLTARFSFGEDSDLQVDEADRVVASHHELLDALRELGASL